MTSVQIWRPQCCDLRCIRPIGMPRSRRLCRLRSFALPGDSEPPESFTACSRSAGLSSARFSRSENAWTDGSFAKPEIFSFLACGQQALDRVFFIHAAVFTTLVPRVDMPDPFWADCPAMARAWRHLRHQLLLKPRGSARARSRIGLGGARVLAWQAERRRRDLPLAAPGSRNTAYREMAGRRIAGEIHWWDRIDRSSCRQHGPNLISKAS